MDPRLFRRLCDGFDLRAVYRDVSQNRRAREVPVPDAVVDDLIMPETLARLEVECHQGFAEQAVSRPVAAVFVACWRLDR